jgi:transposase
MTQREAAQKMGVSDRWVRTLLKRMKERGDGVVVHALRGRASNRKLAAKEQARAMELLKQPQWHDFGPTFASQQLAKRHKLEVSKETLRAWMIEAGLWKPGSRRIEGVHCWRPRRSGFGELVQWDTSDHDWLEGRGPVRYLVRLIDDATSWSWGRLRGARRDAVQHGGAVGIHREKRANGGRLHRSPFDVRGATETGREPGATARSRPADATWASLTAAGHRFDSALSPQAKGRIECSFRTAQDRLVKDLRLARVSTMEAANVFLETEYWPEWNARFARPVADFPNQHRALSEPLELAAILCHVEQRIIGNDYTFSFAGQRYQIERSDAQAGMRHQRLRIELRLDGELKARYQQRYLNIAECNARIIAADPAVRKPVRKDHNAGGKNGWMQGFFDRPSPPLWKLLGDSA